jgi:ribosomal protein S12 methylthiotransferase
MCINRDVLLSGASSAFVKLAEGCSNNCSFCAIPLIRGPVRSRSLQSITEEVRKLADSGIREVNLIAQDLGSYGKDLSNDAGPPKCLLPNLLRELDKLSGDFIIRMLYIHPDNFPLEILDICADSDKILPYFDIPFQHASGPVLAAMNRAGNAEKHLSLLSAIRTKLPEAVIRTTFLLGFPGETKDDLDDLEAFIRAARLEWAGFFTYSPEKDTPAFGMESERRHKRRQKGVRKSLEELQALQSAITQDVLKRFIGRRMSLLVEEAVEEEDLYLCRAWMQAPEVDGLVVLNAGAGSLNPGRMVSGKVKAVNGIDLEADFLS